MRKLRQVLPVEARPQHTQAPPLRQGAAIPMSSLPEEMLPTRQPGKSHSKRALDQPHHRGIYRGEKRFARERRSFARALEGEALAFARQRRSLARALEGEAVAFARERRSLARVIQRTLTSFQREGRSLARPFEWTFAFSN